MLELKIKKLDCQIKDLPFKVNQEGKFLKESIKLDIKDLIDFDNYFK